MRIYFSSEKIFYCKKDGKLINLSSPSFSDLPICIMQFFRICNNFRHYNARTPMTTTPSPRTSPIPE